MKVFTDFTDDIDLLSDVEVGRLFRAMLSYAENGQQPSLTGNEKFIWGTVKKKIDAQRESYDQKCDAAKKAIEARWSKMPNDTNGMPKNTNGMPNDAERIKTKTKEQKTKEQKTKNNNPPYPPKGSLDIAMDDFAEFRKGIKKPLTAKARELTLAELEKLAPGDDAKKVAIINQSIQRGWQGVFALKGEVAIPTKTDFRWEGDDLDKAERILNGKENV